ncbi:MAG: ATP-grasp domain-containing protein [Acidobacteriia bacterium]|nr:ATP-grasp domain-containing protein [Terriglobia bacterium]
MLSRRPVQRLVVEGDEEAYSKTVARVALGKDAVAVFAHYENSMLGLGESLRGTAARVIAPPRGLLELARSKHSVLDRAQRIGLRVPRTLPVRASDADAPGFEDRLRSEFGTRWPVFVKMDCEIGVDPGPGKRYMVLRGPTDLPALRGFACGRGPLLVQEYVEGRGCGIAGLFWRGEAVCVGGHVRLRESHATGGVSTYCEARVVPAAWNAAIDLMRDLAWSGPAMVEFKLTRGGEAVLMEINPRFWGTLPLYVRAGLNIPFAAYEAFVLGRTRPDNRIREGLRMRFLRNDLLAIVTQSKGIRAAWEVGKVVATTPFFVFDPALEWSDPGPFLHQFLPARVRGFVERWFPAASATREFPSTM